MTELNVINTWSLGPITHRMDLRDLDLVSTSSGTVLYATNGSTGGVVNFSVNASTGALSYRDAITLPHLASVDGSVHLEQTRFGGQDYIVNLGRHADGLEAIRIGNGSNLDTRIEKNLSSSNPIHLVEVKVLSFLVPMLSLKKSLVQVLQSCVVARLYQKWLLG